jgi:hypothetical protein
MLRENRIAVAIDHPLFIQQPSLNHLKTSYCFTVLDMHNEQVLVAKK